MPIVPFEYVSLTLTEAIKRSFTILASDLINSLPTPDYLPEHFNSYKAIIYKECFARDKEDWNKRIHNEGIIL